MLPVEPKLGKMLILGTIFNCLDPILIIVTGLSVRDPFLIPFDVKDVSCQNNALKSAVFVNYVILTWISVCVFAILFINMLGDAICNFGEPLQDLTLKYLEVRTNAAVKKHFTSPFYTRNWIVRF